MENLNQRQDFQGIWKVLEFATFKVIIQSFKAVKHAVKYVNNPINRVLPILTHNLL